MKFEIRRLDISAFYHQRGFGSITGRTEGFEGRNKYAVELLGIESLLKLPVSIVQRPEILEGIFLEFEIGGRDLKFYKDDTVVAHYSLLRPIRQEVYGVIFVLPHDDDEDIELCCHIKFK